MKAIYTFCMLLLICFFPNAVKAQITNTLPVTSTPIPNWANSVVKIWYECNGKIFTGTGVIISKSGYILTAAHVGRDCNAVPNTVIKVGVIHSAYTAPGQMYTATLIHTSTDNVGNPNVYDLKLLKIDSISGAKLNPVTFSTTAPFPGEDIFVAGFPDLPFAFLIQKQAPLSIYKTGVLSCFAEGNNNIPTRIHYGGNGLPGFSGGPIFDKQGHLIGIHSTRSTANISNLLSKTCTDPPNAQNPCWGNAVRFKVPGTGGSFVTQEIYLDHGGIKNILDNYSWGTSIWRIPQQWITLLQ